MIDRVDFAEWPLLAKLSTLGIDAHMGVLFGPVNQILLAALAPLASRGAWQKLPAWGIIVGVPIVFAIGWIMPVLGVTLLAFLAIDLIVGTIAARRRRAVPTSPAPAGR